MRRTKSTPAALGLLRRSGLTAAVLALAGLLVLSACSSSKKASDSSGGSSSGTSTSAGGASGSSASGSTDLSSFQADLAKVEAAPKYEGPTSGPKPTGSEKVAAITCAAVNTGCAAGAANVVEAAKAIGWTATVLDGKGTPAGASQAMVSAINDGAKVIVLIAISSPSIIQGMTAAKRANVPVISVVADNPVGTGPGQVYAEISGQTVQSGKAIADYFVVHSKGTAKVASFHVASLASTRNRYKGFIDEIRRCSGCKVVSDQTYGLVSQSDFANMIKATMNAHPDIQYIFVDISQYATIAATALQQTGQQKKVGVAGVDCLPPEVESIKQGTGEIACANAVVSLDGYPAINEAIRALAGEKPLNEAYPLRLVDKTILDKEQPPYLGGFTPATGYLKLWGK
jgi:ribose transport system substrate-binding protein